VIVVFCQTTAVTYIQ
jgi:nicotinamidase-related amidase